MAGPAVIVEQYFNAWTSKDFEQARSLLHDDLSFKGPIEMLESADALMGSVKGLAQIVTGAERRALLELGRPGGRDLRPAYGADATAPSLSGTRCETARSRRCKRSSMPARSRRCSSISRPEVESAPGQCTQARATA